MSVEHLSEYIESISILDHLAVMKSTLLTYYYPNGKLSESSLLVLHHFQSGKEKQGDAQTAEEILKFGGELELTEIEKKQFKTIANGDLVNRFENFINSAVQKLMLKD